VHRGERQDVVRRGDLLGDLEEPRHRGRVRGVLQTGHALVAVVVAHGPDEDVDPTGRPVGDRVEHLRDVERGVPDVDEAYDGQGGGHAPRVLTRRRRGLGAGE